MQTLKKKWAWAMWLIAQGGILFGDITAQPPGSISPPHQVLWQENYNKKLCKLATLNKIIWYYCFNKKRNITTTNYSTICFTQRMAFQFNPVLGNIHVYSFTYIHYGQFSSVIHLYCISLDWEGNRKPCVLISDVYGALRTHLQGPIINTLSK